MSRHLTLTVGRDADCDVVLAHETVSRVHAELVVGDEGLIFLCDRASSHGLFVAAGGQWEVVTQQVVEPDDTVLLGELQIRVDELIQRGKAARRRAEREGGDAAAAVGQETGQVESGK